MGLGNARVFATDRGPYELRELTRRKDGSWSSPGVEVRLTSAPDAAAPDAAAPGDRFAVDVTATAAPRWIAVRWQHDLPVDAMVLGDAWERSYGDLAWRPICEPRLMPWSWLAHCPDGTSTGMGVEVAPNAMCSWMADPHGVTLWIDLRSGTEPVDLAGGTLRAAVVRVLPASMDRTPFQAQCSLSKLLSPSPLAPTSPVVGANNWYYAYGAGFDADAVVQDARTVVELAGGHPVRPFGVVDAGWSPGGTAPGGPWNLGLAGVFDDMADLADRIRAVGARPGLWFRPLLSREPSPYAFSNPLDGSWALDPSHPAVLDQVRDDIGRFRDWGFDLVKHDFSTYDFFRQWGSTMGWEITPGNWTPVDRGRTNAQILRDFYATVREAAGPMVVIGCNTIGHLAAGLVEVQRTGDDTSGKMWERTRRMGVNTLAFRLAQHGSFFTVDADCIPVTAATPWSLNRQFLSLVAASGTALFVSVDPAQRSEAVDEDLSRAIRLALDGGIPGGIEPLDWQSSPTPSRWRVGRDVVDYSWAEPWGVSPWGAAY